MQYWGAFVQPLLQWKSNKYYIFWGCICSLWYPASKANAPYFIAVCGLSGSATFFHIISLKERPSEKKSYWTQNVCFDCLYYFSLNHFSFSEELCEIYINTGHVKYPLLLSCSNETYFFFDILSKNNQITNFIKFRPVGAGLFHAVGRTYMTKPIVAFRNFANAPKNVLV
jgi:hypothetical protein